MSIFTTLGRLVPPPSFITMPAVGVDISDTSMKYIQFAPDVHGRKRLSIKHHGDLQIPEGVLKRGVVNDPKLLSEVIKEMKSVTGAEYVRVSLPEERAYLFETEIAPGKSEAEIRGMLEFKLEENVPIPPQEAFFDYEILNERSKTGGFRVAVAAYARDTIMDYHEACTSAGVTPLSFEVEAQAIARASLPVDDMHTHVIVDFGKTRTGIGIVYKNTLMYTSTIDIGGAHLSNALRRQLGNQPESDLTVLKNTEGLVRGVVDTRVHEALISTVSVIRDEISARIAYWQSRENAGDDRRIESIVLCGGSVNLKGIVGYFSGSLGVPVERASVWRNVLSLDEEIPPIDRRHAYGYATAIGLALHPFL